MMGFFHNSSSSFVREIQLGIFAERLFNEREIKVKFSKAAKNFIAEKGYEQAYGARPLKRAVMVHVENLISKAIMKKEIKDGDSITVDVKKEETYIK